MNQELLDYVITARAKGSDDVKIKEELLIAGWKEADLDQALATNIPTSPSSASEVASVIPKTFKERLKDKKLWESIVGLVLIVVAGAYFYMVYATGPQKVWDKLSFDNYFSNVQGWHKHELVLTYSDTSSEQKSESNAKIQADILFEKDKITGSGNIAAGYQFSGSEYSFSGIEMRFLDNAAYINLKSIPFLFDYLKEYDGWLKVDSKTAKAATGTAEDQELVKEVLDILKQNKVVSSHKYLGKEDVLGKKTFRYSLVIDKQALIESYKQILELDKNNTAKLSADDLKSIADGITRSEISIDLWLGVTDSEVYRVQAGIRMPDFLKKSKAKSNDVTTMANIRQIGLGLELYYNDYNHYPDSLNELEPIYIYALPIPNNNDIPECPIKDAYAYNSINNKSAYSLKACISTDVGVQTAGIIESTPAGIRTSESHPEWSKEEDLANSPLNSSFNFDWKIIPSSPVTVTAPSKYYDVSTAFSRYESNSSSNQTPLNSTLPVDQFSR